MYILSDQIAQTSPDYVSNKLALEQYRREREKLSMYCYGIGFGAIAAGSFNPAWLAIGITPLALYLKRLQKISQIYLNMGGLLQAFENHGVEIIPEITVPELGNLDLLVKFPGKLPCFGIALRSQGKSHIYYNEEKESLFFRRINKKGQSKGWYRWEPDHIQRLSDQEYWLRKNQRSLFGKTSKETRRPVVKLLVLTGDTQLGITDKEHLFTTLGNTRVLLIRKKTSLYVLEEAKLINFIEAWLAPSTQESQPED